MASFSPVAFDAFLTEDADPPAVMLNHPRFEPDGGAPPRGHDFA